MRVLLATKDQNLRISLQLLVSEEPGMRVVGTASEADGLQALIGTTHPDLVIMDWDLPGQQAGELLGEARQGFIPAKFIVLVNNAEDIRASELAGEHINIIKASPPERLINAIYHTLKISQAE